MLHRDLVRCLLWAMVTVWCVTFIYLGWLRQRYFGTTGFDLGIYDQAVWLLSRLADPFNTIRGLNVFAHHMNLVLWLITPLYWVAGGPVTLLAVQAIAQASGAVAIFLLARDRLGERWLALALALVVLLNPAYQIMAWAWFHPEVLAVPAVLFAYWAARAGHWRWYAVSVVLALACKEDVALAVSVLGVVVALQGHRRYGIITSAAAIAWYALTIRVLIPAFNNGMAPFFIDFFGKELGSTPGQVLANILTNPTKAWRLIAQSDRRDYLWSMFVPVAFVPFGALRVLLIGAPMLAVNLLSAWPYQRGMGAHYSALVLAGLFPATVEAIALLGRTPGLRRFLVGLVVATSLAATVVWGPSPLSTKFAMHYPLHPGPKQGAMERAVARVPASAAVSTTWNLSPHLTLRKRVYEFPAPWLPSNWGVRGENLPNPRVVDWLVIDRAAVGPEHRPLLDRLVSQEFAVVQSEQEVVVARRERSHDLGAENP